MTRINLDPIWGLHSVQKQYKACIQYRNNIKSKFFSVSTIYQKLQRLLVYVRELGQYLEIHIIMETSQAIGYY